MSRNKNGRRPPVFHSSSRKLFNFRGKEVVLNGFASVMLGAFREYANFYDRSLSLSPNNNKP